MPLHILQLPRELRDKIWKLAFAESQVAPSDFCQQDVDCRACRPLSNHFADIQNYDTVFRPLMSCKQLYREASEIFSSTLTIHLSNLELLLRRPNSRLNPKFQNIAFYIHVSQEHHRLDWESILSGKILDFHHVQHLMVYWHARAPVSFYCLIDAIHVLGPLCHIPKTMRQTLYFDHAENGVMFETLELGVITTQDALTEHEAVVRECIADAEFQAAAGEQDEQRMTLALLEIARIHENSWIESLTQRRRATRET